MSYEINNNDFKNLRFPIHKNMDKPLEIRVPELFDAFPELKELNRTDRDAIILWVIFMYDKESPLIKKHRDLAARKKHASNLAGLTGDKEYLDHIYSFKDGDVMNFAIRYLKYQNNLTLSMLASCEYTFYEYQQKLFELVEDSKSDKDKNDAVLKKTKIIADSDDIANRIENYYRKLYVEDSIIETVRNFSPESQAD